MYLSEVMIYIYLCLMVMLLIILLYKYMLIVLILLEMLVLNLSVVIYMMMGYLGLEAYMVYYLIFSVCESVLGLIVLVMVIRYYGDELYYSLNMVKY